VQLVAYQPSRLEKGSLPSTVTAALNSPEGYVATTSMTCPFLLLIMWQACGEPSQATDECATGTMAR
jgi:hypothetical protein